MYLLFFFSLWGPPPVLLELDRLASDNAGYREPYYSFLFAGHHGADLALSTSAHLMADESLEKSGQRLE